jgi:hypothetical protein
MNAEGNIVTSVLGEDGRTRGTSSYDQPSMNSPHSRAATAMEHSRVFDTRAPEPSRADQRVPEPSRAQPTGIEMGTVMSVAHEGAPGSSDKPQITMSV